MGYLKNNPKTIAVFSRGIAKIPFLKNFLQAEKVIFRPRKGQASEIDAVVGWGEKSNTRTARLYASRHHLPYLALEDGFFRSVGLGVNGDPPLSLIVDDIGTYYDARSPSRLEAMLNASTGPDDPLDDDQLCLRSKKCIETILHARLSKYNSAPDITDELSDTSCNRVLVVDQTFGDLSVVHGTMHEGGFDGMLRAAAEENPGAEIIVKMHPDVLAKKKQGYLTSVGSVADITLFTAPVSPQSLFHYVDRVYTVTSQVGFEALLAQKPVTCFGAPFYAGWGLTDDRVPISRRTQKRSLEALFAAACILYPTYIDPDSGDPCEIETVLDHLARQRHYFARNRGMLFCVGFSRWKQASVRAFLRSPGNRIHFVKTAAQAARSGFNANSRLIVWGRKHRLDLNRLAEEYGVQAWRMEDGFLRSIGLGSDLTAPASLVLDTSGIYYDPTCPSDLERILLASDFSKETLDRAAHLRQSIVATRLSKYNVGVRKQLDLSKAGDRPIVLVPGQVEDDASIELGCEDIRTNLDLLKAVREKRPGAFVVYKPHPDVVGRNRKGGCPLDRMREYCDLIVEEVSIADFLDAADEVHCMTSLVGFEALLRGLEVHVYGKPFYSGWGLTHDRHEVTRRGRALSLDMLVAGTLLTYPRYVNAHSGRFTTPEHIVDALREARDAAGNALAIKMPWTRRQLRKLAHIWKGILDAG
ncbi:MAG: capsular polysaccharide biosynthesis protein [Myxococcota bacterium]|nr:capsular polysaccharide biosynthesis protein [Myxococcota bacterium]